MRAHVTSVEVHEETHLIVYIDFEGMPGGYPLTVPHGALETRRQIYELDTHEDALDSCVREHALILANSDQEAHAGIKPLAPEGDERHHQLGGVHRAIRVTHSEIAEKERAQALKHLAPHLGRFRASRGIPDPGGNLVT